MTKPEQNKDLKRIDPTLDLGSHDFSVVSYTFFLQAQATQTQWDISPNAKGNVVVVLSKRSTVYCLAVLAWVDVGGVRVALGLGP